jgi:uncharacterized membrane-anchored protein
MPEASKVPGWRFWVPLGLQVLILAAVPLPKLPAYAAGTPLVLRTVPRDPVDLMRGRYAVLGYEIATDGVLKKLPGWKDELQGDVYFTLAPAQPAWKAVAISDQPPSNLPAGDVVLRGERKGGDITFGLEEYYLPESEGERLANAMRDHREGNLAQIKVDGRGTAVLTGFAVGTTQF